MKLEQVTTLEAFEALQVEWNALLSQSATNVIFLTWQWQHTWWLTYQRGDLWIVTARDDNGTLIGIAPWFLDAPDRIVRTIGCVEVTDYLDVIAAPAHRDEFYAALADFVIEHRSVYSHIDLCNIPAGSPTLDVLPRLLTERGFVVEVKKEDVCPHIDLPDDFEKYLESLEKSQRHELRRKIRRAENGDDDVKWYIADSRHNLNEEIERFLDLMAASHQEKAKFLDLSKNRAFFKAIMPVVAECGWLQLSFLTVEGKAAATYLNFDFNNQIQVYNSGLLPASFAHLSPGIVLLCYNIRHAIEQRRAVFDFLQGNEDYKYRMGAKDREVLMLEAKPA